MKKLGDLECSGYPLMADLVRSKRGYFFIIEIDIPAVTVKPCYGIEQRALTSTIRSGYTEYRPFFYFKAHILNSS